MSAQSNSVEYSSVCSYLGLADDADSHATYPTEAHRCYRLPNPTRIAANHQESFCLGAEHVNCPVFQGDGLPRPSGAPAAAAAGVAAATPPPGAASTPPTPRQTPPQAASGELRPKGASPFGSSRASSGAPSRGGGTTRPPGQRRAGQLNSPRPRAGGLSMPVITVALFALAGVVLAVAIVIQQMAAGDDDPGTSPANQVGVNATNTVEAQNATATAGAGGGNTTPGAGTTTPPGTPGNGTTPGTTPATTPGGGASTHTVQAGEFCSTIADNAGISLEEFFELNPDINTDCSNLGIGQVVNIGP